MRKHKTFTKLGIALTMVFGTVLPIMNCTATTQAKELSIEARSMKQSMNQENLVLWEELNLGYTCPILITTLAGLSGFMALNKGEQF